MLVGLFVVFEFDELVVFVELDEFVELGGAAAIGTFDLDPNKVDFGLGRLLRHQRSQIPNYLPK